MTARPPIVLVRWPGVLLAICLLAGSAVAGCSSSPSTAAPTMADVRSLLARHGKAVLDHDRSAFLLDIDPDARSATFRDQQRAAFANLVKLPLTSWSYAVEYRSGNRAAELAAGKRYGSAALIVRVSQRYALRGVDRIATNHDLWWTFVRHDGRVTVAADDGPGGAAGGSWRGPWDFGPLSVVRGAHSLVLGPSGNPAALRAIAAAVDAAVPAVSAVWGDGWLQDVGVVVPSSNAELSAQVGAATDISTDVAALAVSDGVDPLSGTVYGQRLIVNPAGLGRLSAVGRQITIRHEVTHIASAPATTDASPRWLVEGFADYVGNLGSGQSVRTTATELRADVAKGRGPSALPDDTAFATTGEAPQAYEGAWLACRLIAADAGQDGLIHFYRLVGASPDAPAGAVATALHRVLHESTARFTAQWRAYLKAELT